jgi:uncharacterized protein GlcG (DUF336 family)
MKGFISIKKGGSPMRFLKFALLAGSMLAATAASAQAPQTEHNVSMGMAMAIMQATIDQCTKDGKKISVVIVDKSGNVAASIRGDGTGPHTMETARVKAYTSSTRGITSLEFKQATSTPETMQFRLIPGTIALGGGVPIKMGTETIGGVGVSGSPLEVEDEVCAKAGIEKVAAQLK